MSSIDTNPNPAPQRLRRRTAQPHRTTLADNVGSSSTTKNVIVLGGSYGGSHAATVLANKLPPSHRVILIERNSHFNHLYVFPRFSTLPGHEHKAFIPYSCLFKDAPIRPSRQSRKQATDCSRDGRTPTAETNHDFSSSSTSNVTPNEGSSEQMLGMGAFGGSRLKNKLSSFSDKSDDSRFANSRSRFGGSSASRSSSVDDDSSLLFEENDRLRIERSGRRRGLESSPASSASSSYLSHSSERVHSDDKDDERAAKLAGPEGMGQALANDAQAVHAEERLGRPEMKVEELSEAIEKGIQLEDSNEDGVNEDAGIDANVAQGFEESSPHLVLQANVTKITPTHVEVQAVDTSSGKQKNSVWSIDSVSIPYSHIIYALGSHLPDPLRTEARTKSNGIGWMQEFQKRVKSSQEIVLVGGGALGVEFATDIKSVYPTKSVTLIHSRKQLLPNFDVQVHNIALKRLEELGVKVVLGERLALTEGCPRGSTTVEQQGFVAAGDQVTRQGEVCPPSAAKGGEGEQARNEGICLGNGRKRVKTTHGKEFDCDLLLLCTGQQPNSNLMANLSPTSVDSNTRLIRVLRTLQVKVPDPNGALAQMPFVARPPCGDCDCFLDKKAAGGQDEEEIEKSNHPSCLSNVYAIGDVADAFGALNAGYQAWTMAEIASDNIVRDIKNEQDQEKKELQHFIPVANMLKLSLGLGKMVFQGGPDEKTGIPMVELREDPEDLSVEGVWQFMAGVSTEDMYI